MGSGLILLVIVGAWLAVLVPMALRSHDSATSLKSTDRFSDAMRVLARRGDRTVIVPRRGPSLVVSATKSARPSPAPQADRARQADPADLGAFVSTEVVVRDPLTPAQRRCRLLLVLLGTSAVSLGLALTVVPRLLWVHLLADLLLVAFVLHLRQQAVLRAERRSRVARSRPRPVAGSATAAPGATAARRRPTRVAGIPDRMPTRPAPLTTPLPAPAARYDDRPFAATGTSGEAWSPVPVPPPTYVGKATAPKRIPRVLDLTHPGEWSTALEGDSGLDILDNGQELEDILSRRRA